MEHDAPELTLPHEPTLPLVGAVVKEHGFGLQVCADPPRTPREQERAAPVTAYPVLQLIVHELPDATLAQVLTAPFVGAVVRAQGFGVQVCLLDQAPNEHFIVAPLRTYPVLQTKLQVDPDAVSPSQLPTAPLVGAPVVHGLGVQVCLRLQVPVVEHAEVVADFKYPLLQVILHVSPGLTEPQVPTPPLPTLAAVRVQSG